MKKIFHSSLKTKLMSQAENERILWQVVQDFSFKDAIISTKTNTIIQRNILRGNFIMNVLEEELFTMYIGMVFRPFDFMYKPFNDLILRVVQSGLIGHWHSEMHRVALTTTKAKQEPVVLTWNHVYVGFYICLICLVLSTVCYINEVLYFRFCLLKKRRNNSKLEVEGQG